MYRSHRTRWILLSLTVVVLFSLGAWQGVPPLALTAEVSPAQAAVGETLVFSLLIQVGDRALEDTVVRVTLPRGTVFQAAEVEEELWEVSPPPVGATGVVMFAARDALAPQASSEFSLEVLVTRAAEASIVLDDYTATARQLDAPVEGEPLSVPLVAPTATPTPSPQPTATPVPLPTPTRILLPSPTPTPNLSSEEVRVGTVTVLVFVVIVVAIIVFAIVWMVRNARGSEGEETEE